MGLIIYLLSETSVSAIYRPNLDLIPTLTYYDDENEDEDEDQDEYDEIEHW